MQKLRHNVATCKGSGILSEVALLLVVILETDAISKHPARPGVPLWWIYRQTSDINA